MFYQDRYVRTGNAVVIWDGITRPEHNDSGKLVHSIAVAIKPGSPEIAELEQLATKCLQDSKFRGQLPAGGNWPVNVIPQGEVDPAVVGYTKINAKTYNGAPQVFDSTGQLLDPMQYTNMLYAGAIVQVLVHAYDYDNKNKGVSFGIDGIMIIDATVPKLNIAGGVNAAAAFGAGPSAPAPAVPGTVTPPPPAGVAPAPDFLNGPTHKMTAKANGIPYESFIAQNWTDEQLIAQGYMEA